MEKIERLTTTHPYDWQLWQGLAEYRDAEMEFSYRPGDKKVPDTQTVEEKKIKDYSCAIFLNPTSAQLHSNLGLIYLSRVQYTRKESTFVEETDVKERFDFEEIDVEMASREIRRAMELEPDNAFYNYLLAHLLVAQKRDEEALRNLSIATKKNYCEMHRRVGALARIRLLEMAGLPRLEARATALQTTALPQLSLLRDIARLSTGLGMEFQQKGEHDRAIDVYQSVFEMGREIREGAWLIIDELVGIAIQNIATQNFSPAEEELEAIKDWEEKRERELKLTNERFRKYLIEHGRWGFAEGFQREMVSGRDYVEGSRAYHAEFQSKVFLMGLSALVLTDAFCYSFNQSILYLILFSILSLTWPYFSWETSLKWNYKRVSIFIFVSVLTSVLLVIFLFVFSLRNFWNCVPYVTLLTPVLVGMFVFVHAFSKLWKAEERVRPQIISSSMNCLRIALPRILAVFLLFYALLLIPTITIRGKLEKHLNAELHSEADLVREFKGPYHE